MCQVTPSLSHQLVLGQNSNRPQHQFCDGPHTTHATTHHLTIVTHATHHPTTVTHTTHRDSRHSPPHLTTYNKPS